MFGEPRIVRLVAIVGLALLVTSGVAAGETIRIDPPGAEHVVGTAAFSVFVKADSATNLIGYQFDLNYNSSSVVAGNVGTLAAPSPDSTLASNVTTLSAGSPDTTLTSAMTSTTLFAAPTQTSVNNPGVSTTTLTTGITTGDTSLTVGSSGLISPGGTTLAAAITTTGATTITLPSTGGINHNDTLHIDSEDVRVNTISNATTLSVTRGVNGTTAATHLINAVVVIYPTIRIDAEDMAVVTVPDVTHVTVERAVNGTSAASHSSSARVLNEPSVVPVQSTSGFAVSNTIQADAEQMTVLSTTDNATTPTLTVTRAVNATTASAHSVGAAVVLQPTHMQVANTSGLVVSNTIQIHAERMTITVVTPGAPGFLDVTRGVSGTIPAAHANGALIVKQPDTAIVANAAAAGLMTGNNIQIDGETMNITGIVSNTLTVTRAVSSLAGNHSSGALVVKQPTTLSVASAAGISPGSVIQIDSEQMGVQSVGAGTLTVTRGYNATNAALHANGATVSLLSVGAGAGSIKVAAPDVLSGSSGDVALGGGVSETAHVTSKSGPGPYLYNLSSPTTHDHAAGGTVSAQPSVLALSSIGGLVTGSTIQVDAEQMTVTAISSPNVTVTRGVNGTTPAAHAFGAPVTVQVVGAGAGTIASVSDILANVNLSLGASVLLDPDGANPETLTATAKSGSGAGPFTYTLSSTTAFAHAAGATIQNPALTFGGAVSVKNGAWSQMAAATSIGATSITVGADALQSATLPAPLILGYGLSSQEVATVTSKLAIVAGGYTYGMSAPLTKAHLIGAYVTPSTTSSFPGTAADWLESTGRTAACSYTPLGSGKMLFGCTTLDLTCQNPSATTTLAADTLLGATQISVGQDILSGVTLPAGIAIEPGTGNADGVTVTGKAGTGPFTYTLSAPTAFAHVLGAPVSYQTGCTAKSGPAGSDILATIFFTPANLGPGALKFPASTDTLLLEFNPAQPLVPIVVTSTNGLTVSSGAAPVVSCPDLDPVTPKVSFGDLLKLAQAWNSVGPPSPSSNWNPLADLNGDNKVGFADLLILAGLYNQICP